MDDDEREAFLSIINRVLKSRNKPFFDNETPGIQETRLLALDLIYKKSPPARNYIGLCMTLYARAIMEGKSDMMIDGMKKLYELVFGPDEKEEKPCTIKTDAKS